MSWIALSLLAALMWAAVNVTDKFTMSRWVKNPMIPISILGAATLTAGVVSYAIIRPPALDPYTMGAAFLAGFLHMAAVLVYMAAIRLEDVSRLVPLFHLEAFFIAFLAAMFLGEIFTPLRYAGIGMLILGAMLISYKGRGLRPGKGFWLMIVSTLIFTSVTFINKVLLNHADYWSVMTYTRMSFGMCSLPLIFASRNSIAAMVKQHGKKAVAAITANQAVSVSAYIVFLMAISSGFVTLVDAFQTLQSLFVLAITIVLTSFWPGIITEDIRRGTVALKAAAIAMMFIGVLIVS